MIFFSNSYSLQGTLLQPFTQGKRIFKEIKKKKLQQPLLPFNVKLLRALYPYHTMGNFQEKHHSYSELLKSILPLFPQNLYKICCVVLNINITSHNLKAFFNIYHSNSVSEVIQVKTGRKLEIRLMELKYSLKTGN